MHFPDVGNNSADFNITESDEFNISLAQVILFTQGQLEPWLLVILSLIILFTLLGNGLVVGAVVSFHRLRTVTNYFVVSLAVADLAVAVLVMPFAVLFEIKGQWVFGWVFCYFWISCDVMCCTASILHLCVIAVDRYLAITEPLTYAARWPTRRPGKVIAGVWACSAAISFVPVFMGWFANETIALYVDSPVCGLHVNRVYAIVSSMTSFYCPLVVMVIVYARIFCIARRQAKEIVRLEKSLDRNGYRGQTQARRNTRDLKAIKTLGTLMGMFCVSWLPFFIVYVIEPFSSTEMSKDLVLAITWLGYSNSFFNPCVYGLINKDFRVAYKRLLLCQRNRNSGLSYTTPGSPEVINPGFERNRMTYDLVTGDCVGCKTIPQKSEYELGQAVA